MPKLRHRTPHTDTDRARCRMCGTTVEVGTDGCCPLGHPAVAPPPGPVAAGLSQAAPAEAGPVEAGPTEAGPTEAEPAEAGPVEGPPAAATPAEARPAEDAPVDELAPATIPAEPTTPADEDSGAASRLDWLDWDAAASQAALPSEPAALAPAVDKLPPPPAPAAPQLPPAERDDGRAALDALLAAHHQRVPPSAVDLPIEPLPALALPAPTAVSPAPEVHGDADTDADAHDDARALAELLFGAAADEQAGHQPARSRRLAVRLVGAVMLLLLTAAMTAAAVVAS